MTAKPHIPDVLAGRYASAAMADVWSPEAKIVMERRLWLAVASAQVELGLEIPQAALGRLPARHRRGRPRVDRRARASHEARRQGAHRGVQRPGRPRVRAPGHDLARPHRERRAAAGARCAAPRARQVRGRPRPALRPGDRLLRHRAHRPLAQRAGPDHHAGQAVRLRRRRAARRVRPPRRSHRQVPAARHQGPRGHRPGHARSHGRRRVPARGPGVGRGDAPGLRQGARQRRPGVPAVAGLRRRLRAGAGLRRARRAWPPRSG